MEASHTISSPGAFGSGELKTRNGLNPNDKDGEVHWSKRVKAVTAYQCQ